MASEIKLTGDWDRAVRTMATFPERLAKAQTQATLIEAHALRKEIVQGLTNQAPGGSSILALSPLTLALRKLARFRGTKALVRRGDLRNNISVVHSIIGGMPAFFVGIKRSAVNEEGKDLTNIGELQEYGVETIVVPVTPMVRNLFLALYIQGLIAAPLKASTTTIVYHIPARPFLRPAFEKWKKGLSRRYALRVAGLMNGVAGRP